MKQLADRITKTSPKSFGMYAVAAQMDRPDLIHMELGKPSADTPQHIKEATIAALQRGEVHYSDLQGTPELREALANRLRQKNKIAVGADQIIVTSGLTHGSYAAVMAFVNQGDEVILLEPFYPQHISKVELAGGTVVTAPLDATRNFRIDPALIEAKITPRTKMIMLINPCNPTGRAYSRAELQGLADLAVKHDLIVVSDEVYEDILFDDAEHISIASLEGMADRTISLFAFTKSYAMDGWRLGYMAAPKAAIGALLKITSNDVTHVNTFIQAGALAAVTGDPQILRGLIEEDRAKRDRLVQGLWQIKGISCEMPEATIYAFPNIAATGLTSQDFATQLLEAEGVVVEAGGFYGASADGHIRICFGSVTLEEIDEALQRIGRFVRAKVG